MELNNPPEAKGDKNLIETIPIGINQFKYNPDSNDLAGSIIDKISSLFQIRFNSLESQFSALSDKVSSLDDKVTSLQKGFETMQMDMEDRFLKLDDALYYCDKKLASVEKKLYKMELIVQEMNSKLKFLKDLYTNLDNKIFKLQESINIKAEENLKEIKILFNSITESIRFILEAFKGRESLVENYFQRMNEIEMHFGDIANQYEQLKKENLYQEKEQEFSKKFKA